MEENYYSREYRVYMEYALTQYLITVKKMDETAADLRVKQEYDLVKEEAEADGYL